MSDSEGSALSTRVPVALRRENRVTRGNRLEKLLGVSRRSKLVRRSLRRKRRRNNFQASVASTAPVEPIKDSPPHSGDGWTLAGPFVVAGDPHVTTANLRFINPVEERRLLPLAPYAPTLHGSPKLWPAESTYVPGSYIVPTYCVSEKPSIAGTRRSALDSMHGSTSSALPPLPPPHAHATPHWHLASQPATAAEAAAVMAPVRAPLRETANAAAVVSVGAAKEVFPQSHTVPLRLRASGSDGERSPVNEQLDVGSGGGRDSPIDHDGDSYVLHGSVRGGVAMSRTSRQARESSRKLATSPTHAFSVQEAPTPCHHLIRADKVAHAPSPIILRALRTHPGASVDSLMEGSSFGNIHRKLPLVKAYRSASEAAAAATAAASSADMAAAATAARPLASCAVRPAAGVPRTKYISTCTLRAKTNEVDPSKDVKAERERERHDRRARHKWDTVEALRVAIKNYKRRYLEVTDDEIDKFVELVRAVASALAPPELVGLDSRYVTRHAFIKACDRTRVPSKQSHQLFSCFAPPDNKNLIDTKELSAALKTMRLAPSVSWEGKFRVAFECFVSGTSTAITRADAAKLFGLFFTITKGKERIAEIGLRAVSHVLGTPVSPDQCDVTYPILLEVFRADGGLLTSWRRSLDTALSVREAYVAESSSLWGPRQT